MGKGHVRFGNDGRQTVVVDSKELRLVVPLRSEKFWFDSLAELQVSALNHLKSNGRVEVDGCAPNSFDESSAQALLERACSEFEVTHANSRGSDAAILKNLLKKGTNTDQVAALAVSIEGAPLHMTPSGVSRLISIASKKSIEHSWTALEALRDVFGGCLLPDTRRLRPWDDDVASRIRPSLSLRQYEQWAFYRTFEATVKRQYSDYISLIENACRSDVEWFRMKALSLAQELLCMKPEAEARLLGLLVNKVGDPAKPVSTRAQKLILSLAEQHPNMKPVIVDELERLLMRSNISLKAQIAGISVLSQTRFTREDKHLAIRLINVYISMFVSFRSSKKSSADDSSSRMLPFLLAGLNRAFPFVSEDIDLKEHLDVLFGLARSSTSFTTAIQALTLLQKIASVQHSISNRFYRSLYESMLLTAMPTSSKLHMYLNLLLRALQDDSNTARVSAFAKRLLQIALVSSPSMICGSLHLVSQLAESHPGLKLLLKASSNENEDVEVFRDADESDDELPKSSSARQLYDPTKRDPQFANAGSSSLWELTLIRKHYHPSVVKFAEDLLSGEPIIYSGDSIRDFSNMAFLDRFVYRNPKKSCSKSDGRRRTVPDLVNSASFWGKDVSEVRADERFFHTYFQLRNSKEKQIQKTKQPDNERDSDAGEDEEDFAMRLFERELIKDGAGPVDVDDNDVDFEAAFGAVKHSGHEDHGEVVNDEDLGNVFDDADLDDDAMDDMLVESGDEGEEENESSGTGAKSRFVDAEEYAELLEMSNEAAAERIKMESWQKSKLKTSKGKRPRGKSHSGRGRGRKQRKH